MEERKIRVLYLTLVQFLTPFSLLIIDTNWLLVSLLLYFILSVYGFSIAFHHTFSHRNFKFSKPIEILLMYIGTCATLVSPMTWAISHHAHHRYTDKEGDPHSPLNLKWKILFYGNHQSSKLNALSIKYLLKDRFHVWLDSLWGYWITVLSFPIISYTTLGINGLLYIWAIPTCAVLWTGIVFALAHNDVNDSSNNASNSLALWILSLGDGNHKKHHENYRYVGRFHKWSAYAIGGKINARY